MKIFASITATFLMILASLPAQAAESWLEETMYSSGKIYVVVVVVAVVLLGIFAYLLWMDKRLRKLEEENSQQE